MRICYILFLTLLISSCVDTNRDVDKIDNIEMTFTYDSWWHESFINVKKDSIIAFFNSDDSIGRLKVKIDKTFIDEFGTLLKSINRNFIDTNYLKCDTGYFNYKIFIKRNNSEIIYHGGDCRKNEQLDNFVKVLIQKMTRHNSQEDSKKLPPPPPEPPKYIIKYKGKSLDFYSEKEYKKFLDSIGIKVDRTRKID